MKRKGNIYRHLVERGNIALALNNAAKHKKRRKNVTNAIQNADYCIDAIKSMLESSTFRTGPYGIKKIYEPKERTIYSLPFFPDRIVHHAIINVVEPFWSSLLDYDAYACRKGKGTHAGARRCMQLVRSYPYVLQCDISKFYPSMDHAILKDLLRHKLKDERFLALLDEIIDSANRLPGATPGKNCPIGNLTSQWFGNLYMGEVDRWLRQEKHVHAYMRYSDDFLMFSDDWRHLESIQNDLGAFLWDRLALRLSKASLHDTERGVDTLGYRLFPKYVLVRKRTARKIRRFVARVNAGEIREDELEHARGTLASYSGVLKHACTKNFRDAIRMDAAAKLLGVKL